MRKILIAGLAFFALAGTAHASSYPGEAETVRPDVITMVHVGDGFWGHRNVQMPCTPHVFLADDLSDKGDAAGYMVLGRGGAPGTEDQCKLWLNRSWIRDNLDGRGNTGSVRYIGQREICQIVVHEMGHLAGLGHTQGGIMDADNSKHPMPYDCITAFPKLKAVAARKGHGHSRGVY